MEDKPLNCEMCGQTAQRTALGGRLCAGCRDNLRELSCARCGVRMLQRTERPSASVCSICLLQDKIAALPEQEMERVRQHLRANRRIHAIKELRQILGSSIGEAAEASFLLSSAMEEGNSSHA